MQRTNKIQLSPGPATPQHSPSAWQQNYITETQSCKGIPARFTDVSVVKKKRWWWSAETKLLYFSTAHWWITSKNKTIFQHSSPVDHLQKQNYSSIKLTGGSSPQVIIHSRKKAYMSNIHPTQHTNEKEDNEMSRTTRCCILRVVLISSFFVNITMWMEVQTDPEETNPSGCRVFFRTIQDFTRYTLPWYKMGLPNQIKRKKVLENTKNPHYMNQDIRLLQHFHS